MVCQWAAHRQIVSIHAPAWGATETALAAIKARQVSIHAPAWGATPRALNKTTVRKFQSTLPRGERRPWSFLSYRPQVVSIHAPAWGATYCRNGASPDGVFQSTLPRGERPGAYMLPSDVTWFQSTLPRGERHSSASRLFYDARVSIHAPAWGATSDQPCLILASLCFNPRSRVGSDLKCPFMGLFFRQFQSTLPRGERRLDGGRNMVYLSFNPRSRVGSD